MVVGLVHSKILTILLLEKCLKFESNEKVMIPIDFSFKYADFRFSQDELKQSTFQIGFVLYEVGEA